MTARAILATSWALQILAVSLATSAPLVPQVDLPARSEEWVRDYGVMDEDAPLVKRARAVFARIAAAADKPRRALPRLLLVEKSPYPIASVLAGGEIVVSKSLLEHCYGRGKELDSRGDPRLALILGHELAHTASDDQNRAYFAIQRSGAVETAKKVEPLESADVFFAQERTADYYGLHYVLTAGFDIDALVKDSDLLFQSLVDSLAREGLQMDPRSPTPRERAQLIDSELREIVRQFPLFYFGTRLLELDRYEDAIRFLDAYRTTFAGLEVLNNLGVAHYQLAAKHLAECDGRLVLLFHLPQVVDAETVKDRTRRRGPESSPCYQSPSFLREIELATQNLEAAVKSGPDYLPARLNLVSAYLLRNTASSALGPAAEARDLEPTSLSRGIYAVALYRFGVESGIDQSDAALAELDRAIDEDKTAAFLHYNRAAILTDRGRMAAAQESLRAFLELEGGGPWADVARERLGEDVKTAGTPSTVLPESCDLPQPLLPLGTPSKSVQKTLRKWDSTPGRLGDLRVRFFTRGEHRALEIGGSIELVEQRLDRDEAERARNCGTPLGTRFHTLGELKRYTAFAIDIRDGEPFAALFFK